MGITIKKTVKTDNTRKLQEIINTLNSKKIKIGIFSGKSDSQILLIASVNEFSCDIVITDKMRKWLHANGLHVKDSTTEIHIPERSFIRKTANEKQDKIKQIVHENLDMLLTFKIDVNTFLNRVGQLLAQETQKTLLESGYKPNHPFTIERKGGKDKPLINTGFLVNSITFQIE